MMDSMESPSWTTMSPSECAVWREQAKSSRFASTGRSAKRRMLSMQELPAREKAQSCPAPAHTRLSCGFVVILAPLFARLPHYRA